MILTCRCLQSLHPAPGESPGTYPAMTRSGSYISPGTGKSPAAPTADWKPHHTYFSGQIYPWGLVLPWMHSCMVCDMIHHLWPCHDLAQSVSAKCPQLSFLAFSAIACWLLSVDTLAVGAFPFTHLLLHMIDILLASNAAVRCLLGMMDVLVKVLHSGWATVVQLASGCLFSASL